MWIRKIQWHTWDGNKLVVQAVTKNIVKENNEIIENTQVGSVKYTYTNISTREQVDKIIEDIISGKIK
jgi:hypothetical protein